MPVGGDAASLSISNGAGQKPYSVHSRESSPLTSSGSRSALMCFTRLRCCRPIGLKLNLVCHLRENFDSLLNFRQGYDAHILRLATRSFKPLLNAGVRTS